MLRCRLFDLQQGNVFRDAVRNYVDVPGVKYRYQLLGTLISVYGL